MTNWSDINPRAALLVPIIWPALYLLMFAVMQLKSLGKPSYQKIPESQDRALPQRKTFRVQRIMAVWRVLDHLLVLYVSYFSVFLSIGAILSTLVFTHSTIFGPREDYHHYILTIVIGLFFGKSFMSLLLAKFPDISSTPFQALGTFFSSFIMFVFVFGSWNRFIHHLWLVFTLCFLQGTFLGILTVMSYHSVVHHWRIRDAHVEFLLILTSLLETFGMLCAGLIGLHTEPSLYRHCFEASYGNRSHCLARSSNPDFWVSGKGGLM